MRPKGPPVGAALNQKSLQVQTRGCSARGPPSGPSPPACRPHTLPDGGQGRGPDCRTEGGWALGWVRGQSSGSSPCERQPPPARRPETPLSSLPLGPGLSCGEHTPATASAPTPATRTASPRCLPRCPAPSSASAPRPAVGSPGWRWEPLVGQVQRRARTPPGGTQGRRSPGLPSAAPSSLRGPPGPPSLCPAPRRAVVAAQSGWEIGHAGNGHGAPRPQARPPWPSFRPGLTCTAPSPRPPAPGPTGRPRPPSGAGWCPGACREGGLRQRQEPLPQTRPTSPAGPGTRLPRAGLPEVSPPPMLGPQHPGNPWDSPPGSQSPRPAAHPTHTHPAALGLGKLGQG